MQYLRKTFLAATTLLILLSVACKQKKDGSFKVIVHYKNADKMMIMPGMPATAGAPKKVMLEEMPFGGEQSPALLDSSTIKNASGTFTLKGSGVQENIYQLSIENGPLVLIANDADEITIDLDFAKHEDYYTVSNSTASKQLKDFIQAYSKKSFTINQVFAEIDSLKKSGASDSALIVATQKKNVEIESLNTFINNSLTGSTHPAVSLFILGLSSRSFQKEEFEKALNETAKKFPEHKQIAQLKTSYDMQQSQGQQQATSWTGKDAPALSLPDADGKPVSIADFKGKYLLVDFWASWCGPCRAENPNVVAVYNKFKGKNFAILGVSLDKEKDAWQKAIVSDKLTWTHVSDLKFWSSNAVSVFKFEGIPYNVLIDPQGKIIAEGLRGQQLEEKLAEVLR